jgi:NAD(P)-dependent dehydrogenase (short-subunit alcohol dehydrogenase family)
VSSRRVVVVSDGSGYVGPDLALLLAEHGHDLVVGDPRPGLVDELTGRGAEVEVVEGVRDLAREGTTEGLLRAALERFGRVDGAVAFTGRIVTGRFLRSEVEDLHAVVSGCMEAPYRFLRTMVPQMVEQPDGGQVLVFTSAAGARPTPGAPLYSAARAGATMLVRNVAAEVVAQNVQINAVGTNFMDFPEFLRANRAEDPEGRAQVESRVPMGRLGTLSELAHFALPFIDGNSRFTTGQFVAFAGGWV